MLVPAWFDYNHYMNSKLAQLKAADPDHWRYATITDLERVFSQSGYNGAEGAYRHFLAIGAKEGVDPNKYFSAEAYFVFKAAQDNNVPVGSATAVMVNVTKNAILNAPDCGSAWAHFTRYGTQEMVNASNNFDTEQYLTAKLHQLWQTDANNWTGKTVKDVADALAKEGLNAVMHYMLWGIGEGLVAEEVPLGDRVWLNTPADWIDTQQLLHNEIFVIGDKTPQNFNLPQNYDIILQVLPSCIANDDAGYGLSFNNALVDLKTGSVAEFLLHPRASQIGLLPIQTFDRKQYNRTLDFAFAVEGRYMSFWTSLCVPCYKPLMYGEPYFPEILDMEYIFGDGPEGPRNYFYALNWGQAELFETTKDRILAFYADGFTKCYWAKAMKIEVLQDPRIIRVDIRDPLPRIDLHRLDLVTEYLYVRAKTDEFPYEFTTNAITQVQVEFQEDVEHSYDPWLEFPAIYPDMKKATEDLEPELDVVPPRLVQTTPGNGAVNVSPQSTIVFAFNEKIQRGSGGTITITSATKTWNLPVEDGRVQFSNKSMVIELGELLPYFGKITVTVDGQCVRDLSNNYWLGNLDNPLSFTTSQEFVMDNDPPHLISTDPANGEQNYDPLGTPIFQFNESVQAGAGYVVFSTDDLDGDGYADHSITVPANKCEFDVTTGTVRLPLGEHLHRNTEYYVTITATAFKDSVGNQFAGITNIDEYRFKTRNVPLVWYIPDLDVAKTSSEFTELNKAFGDKLCFLEWWPMDNYSTNMDDLKDAAADIRADDVVIGAGLGGFYAARLAATVGCAAYLLNPITNPAVQLKKEIGTHTSPQGGQYKLTQVLLDSYDSAPDPRINTMRNKFGLLLAKNDTVVDYTAAKTYYTQGIWAKFTDETADGHKIDTADEFDTVVKRTKELQG